MKKIVNDILQKAGLRAPDQPTSITNWAASLLVTKLQEVLDLLDKNKSDISHSHAEFEQLKTKADINHTHPPVSSVPVGAIFAFPVDGTLPGYLKCNGLAYSKSQYPLLAQMLTEFSSSTQSQFNVPDFRGQYLRGADETTTNHIDPFGAIELKTGYTSNISNKAGIQLPDTFKNHNHIVVEQAHTHAAAQAEHTHGYIDEVDPNSGFPTYWYQSIFGSPYADSAGPNNSLNKLTSAVAPPITVQPSKTNIIVENNGQAETRPKTILVNYYIKHD